MNKKEKQSKHQDDNFTSDCIGFAASIVAVVAICIIMICIKAVIGW